MKMRRDAQRASHKCKPISNSEGMHILLIQMWQWWMEIDSSPRIPLWINSTSKVAYRYMDKE